MPDRKYGKQHQALRAHWARVIDGGVAVACWRCRQPIRRGMSWHLGHTDRGEEHVGPEHARCNVSAANELRAADARRWREERATERSGSYVERLLAADPNAYEHPDHPGVIVRPW